MTTVGSVKLRAVHMNPMDLDDKKKYCEAVLSSYIKRYINTLLPKCVLLIKSHCFFSLNIVNAHFSETVL